MLHLVFSLFCTFLFLIQNVDAIGQATCVSFQSSSNGSVFPVVRNGIAAPVLLSPDEWPGVQRAAADFVSDIELVTQIKPTLSNISTETNANASASQVIIVGTLGKSSLIDQVINNTQLDVSSIQGRWESFVGQEVMNPLPGVDSVSPWLWWADVVPTKHSELFISSSGCSHGPPTVQYRGIFLNDEQPALQNWAAEKFTNGPGGLGTVSPANGTESPFNSLFYTKVFELILRLKGNYLWPAQWSSAFCVDDHLNQPLADMYGIVMGTSHEEPMMRSVPVEWDMLGSGAWDYNTNGQNVYNFWVQGVQRAQPYEGLYTIGMRGDGDLPLVGNIQLLEKIIDDQRGIFASVFNTTDVTTIPQVWTLYQEVEGYYDQGLPVPDDVALMWTDDTYGNMRRYPVASERNRTGGAGVYYHVDMVAGPRDYKWITSTQLSKMYEQMNLAVVRNATRVWVLNVGDLKPYEREIEFWMSLGWNSSNWSPDNVADFVTAWAKREFDVDSADAETVSDVVANLTRYNARRKPELWNSTTFSLVNYREAERVLSQWDSLVNASTEIYNKLAPDMQPSFFQLVQHPVMAASTLGKMQIFAGQNNLRASQARLSTNDLADQVQTLFEKDYDLESEFHTILDGKWDHMMDQTHVGYYYWQQPMTNTMPAVNRVQSRKQALAGVMRIIPEGSMGAWPGDNMFDCVNGYNCAAPTLELDPFSPFTDIYIDVGAGGPVPFTFNVTTNVTWLELSATAGSLSPNDTEQRVFLSIPDWTQLAPGANLAEINFTAVAPNQADLVVPVEFVAQNTMGEVPSNFSGFVESTGVVAFEAAHAMRNTTVSGVFWKELPGLGRTLSGVTPWPRDGDNGANFSAGTGPSLEYDFFLVGNQSNITVVTHLSPSLNANGADRPLAFALQVGSQPIQTSHFIPPDSAPGVVPLAWNGLDGFGANSIVSVNMTFDVSPGAQTLKLFMIEPAVVVQKFDIDAGKLLPSYLGPIESVLV